MMCSMCEAHTNDVVRKNFSVKKVTSDHTKKQTVIFSEEEIQEEALRKVITGLGYDMGKMVKEPAKKGLLGWK